MNNKVIEYLNKNYKYGIPQTDIYENIDVWNSWYKNDVDFHNYKDSYGTTRQMYSLGMAKRVSEDWGSIIFTEKDEITTSEEKNESFVEDYIKNIKLTKMLPEIIEKSAWSGTCGVIIRLKNIQVDRKNNIIPTDKTDYDMVVVDARSILPLRIEHGKIVDVAFISNTYIGKEQYYYVELHELKDEGYVIHNIYLNAKNGNEVVKEGVIKELHTLSDRPLFSILTTPIVNNIENNLGLGISIYGNAIDQLKDCDIKYHNSVMDFVLGGKKLIYNKKLIKYGKKKVKQANGEYKVEEYPIYPDDISKQQFMEIGDALSKDDLIKEYNPDLRAEEDKSGLQFSLDLLSFKCNMGTKYYEFSGGTVVTATQYVGDRQDLVKNATKYRNNLDEFIEDIIKAGLLLGRTIFGENVTEDCDVEVINKDGILISDEEVKQNYLEEIAAGLRSKTSYLMKFYGMSEDEALEELQLIQDEESGELFEEEYDDDEEQEFTDEDMADLDNMLQETEDMLGGE